MRRGLLCALPALLALALLTASCRSGAPPTPHPGASDRPVDRGLASWYGPGFAGKPTASGETFDPGDLTAAHRTLPFGTVVEVVNLDNGRRVTVRINDRGPFVRRRVIDLSRAAAERIGLIGPGVAAVEIFVVTAPPAEPVVLAAGGPFAVQIGAFRQAERAAGLRREVAASFPDTVVRREGGWHKVQVGRLPNRRQAEELLRRLLALGYPAVVVRLGDG